MKIINKAAAILVFLFMVQGNSKAQNAPHKTQNEIIILIDGYRWKELFNGADYDLLTNNKYNRQHDSSMRMAKYWSPDIQQRREKLMPFTWQYIARHGQLYGNRDFGNNVNVANPYWFSYPGRAEVLTGFVDTLINSNDYGENANPNVLEFINNQKGYEGRVAAFVCWNAGGRCLNMSKSRMLVNVPWQDIQGDNLTEAEKLANEMQHYIPHIFGEDERLDGLVYGLAKSYILAKHPKVVYLDLGDIDEYAHGGMYINYLDDIHNLDAMIGELWQTIQQDPFYKDKTTLMVFPDHGRGYGAQWTDHGAKTPHSDETWFITMGPDTPASGEMKTHTQIYQSQYAKMLASLLGFDYVAPTSSKN